MQTLPSVTSNTTNREFVGSVSPKGQITLPLDVRKQLGITNTVIIQKYTSTAPAVYQRCINKILNIKNNNSMNIENKELIEKLEQMETKLVQQKEKAY